MWCMLERYFACCVWRSLWQRFRVLSGTCRACTQERHRDVGLKSWSETEASVSAGFALVGTQEKVDSKAEAARLLQLVRIQRAHNELKQLAAVQGSQVSRLQRQL